jgi:hypothetical protein
MDALAGCLAQYTPIYSADPKKMFDNPYGSPYGCYEYILIILSLTIEVVFPFSVLHFHLKRRTFHKNIW